MRRSTAVRSQCLPFTQKIEQSDAKSWRDVLSIAQSHSVEHRKAVQFIVATLSEFAEARDNGELEGGSGELEKLREQIAPIMAEGDEVRDFRREYSPKRLEALIRAENSNDARGDKILSRFVMAQEARILRDNLRKSQVTAGATAEPPREEGEERGINEESQPGDEPEVRDALEEFVRERDLDADDTEG